MGKRSNFERIERDFYPTPMEAVIPLLQFFPADMNFIEPCAGDGALVRHLENFGGVCVEASDIEPRATGIKTMDALELAKNQTPNIQIITNPPWERKILHSMIYHFITMGYSSWLLFDADWMHTKQSAPYMKFCSHIVSVGRVKWFPETKQTGKDNCCWYRFLPYEVGHTSFCGRG